MGPCDPHEVQWSQVQGPVPGSGLSVSNVNTDWYWMNKEQPRVGRSRDNDGWKIGHGTAWYVCIPNPTKSCVASEEAWAAG